MVLLDTRRQLPATGRVWKRLAYFTGGHELSSRIRLHSRSNRSSRRTGSETRGIDLRTSMKTYGKRDARSEGSRTLRKYA